MKKKAFFILELVLVLLLLSVLYTFTIPKYKTNSLNELTKRVNIYLSYARYKAFIDDKYSDNYLWYKQRWTMKFFRCRKSVGGIYFSIYNDKNLSGHPSSSDSLKDPLTNKNIYSSNKCTTNSSNSKYTLLSKQFDIKTVQLSCNQTNSLGQISFGNDGKIYAKLSNNENEEDEFEITKACTLRFIDSKNNYKDIKIYPKTGYSKII